MYAKIFFIFIFICFFISCQSTNIFDKGTGTSDYRELQSEIRDGETELVITSKDLESTDNRIEERINDIESTSGNIENGINNIESTGNNLEQSIAESEGSEQEIGEVLQSIRNRPIPEDKLTELGIK